jgi:hypothetical protein
MMAMLADAICGLAEKIVHLSYRPSHFLPLVKQHDRRRLKHVMA